jgi:hypothetical protein
MKTIKLLIGLLLLLFLSFDGHSQVVRRFNNSFELSGYNKARKFGVYNPSDTALVIRRTSNTYDGLYVFNSNLGTDKAGISVRNSSPSTGINIYNNTGAGAGLSVLNQGLAGINISNYSDYSDGFSLYITSSGAGVQDAVRIDHYSRGNAMYIDHAWNTTAAIKMDIVAGTGVSISSTSQPNSTPFVIVDKPVTKPFVRFAPWISVTSSNSAYVFDSKNSMTGATRVLSIKNNGTEKFAVNADGIEFQTYANTFWDDLRISANAVKVGSVLPPDWIQFRNDGSSSIGVYTYAFDATNVEQVWFSVQLPHAYKPGTDIKPHVHWSPGSSTNTGSVRWGLEYTWANIDGTFSTTTTIDSDDPADGTAYKHQIHGIGTISGSGYTESSMLMCRFYRNGAHGNDTFTGDALFLEFDFHYEINKPGSDNEIP